MQWRCCGNLRLGRAMAHVKEADVQRVSSQTIVFALVRALVLRHFSGLIILVVWACNCLRVCSVCLCVYCVCMCVGVLSTCGLSCGGMGGPTHAARRERSVCIPACDSVKLKLRSMHPSPRSSSPRRLLGSECDCCSLEDFKVHRCDRCSCLPDPPRPNCSSSGPAT